MSASAAIEFSLRAEEGKEFLRLWLHGEFDICRRDWPEAPDEVYAGADPAHPKTREHQAEEARAAAALTTLAGLGYTHHGGEQWKPPLGSRYSDTNRLNLLTDNTGSHDNWSIRHRIKSGKQQWQMIDDGDPWGKWHDNPRKAIDQALDGVHSLRRAVAEHHARREGKSAA